MPVHVCSPEFHFLFISFGLKNKPFSSGLSLCSWVKKIAKWFNRKVVLSQNKSHTTPMTLPLPPSHLLALKLHPKSSRGRKWSMKLLKYICIKKLMTDKGKSCRAFVKPPQFNLFPFSYLQAFDKWVQSLWRREKSSIVEIQIPPKSWELWGWVCQIQDFPCTWW